MKTLAESIATSLIYAPFEYIDVSQWLFTLRNNEYIECSKDHLAVGNSITQDGKRMSINVEQVSGNLLVQKYVEEIGQKSLCRLVSLSDFFTNNTKTKLEIIWELKLDKKSQNVCELSNHVIVNSTNDFSKLIEKLSQQELDLMKTSMTDNLVAHNEEETPMFAINIERKALGKVWGLVFL